MAERPKRLEPSVTPGQVLLGKYRVDEILGQGAVGIVAKCMHLQLNETVAIKMLRHDVLGDADTVERFTREARAAAKLRSEHVARVSDVGTFDDGVPYMVMEFLNGQDLGELLEQGTQFTVAQVADLAVQTADALAEAHSIGIVHRDVKPSNLFVTEGPDGSLLLKVLDFGISKAPIGVDLRLTQTQSLLGTPAYMSPEQMRSASSVDARSDIWSLGTVIYELVEGSRPFTADSFSEMCVKVACDPPTQATKIPPKLQRVVLRCLEKAPEQRYTNMAELARDLVPFATDGRAAAALVERMQRLAVGRRTPVEWGNAATPRIAKLDFETLVSGPVPVQESADFTEPDEAAAARGRARRIGLAAAAIVGAILIGVLPALWISSRRDHGQEAPATSAAGSSAPAVRIEPIDEAPAAPPVAAPTVPAPAPTPTAAPAPPPPKKTTKPVRRPPRKDAAPCDVYLNPHGCPR